MPFVSIITPSLNQGEFIEDCIISVKAQTYQNFEHIIVDGGSTDETLKILRKYEGTYNMRWISEKDTGIYNAVNKGVRMAEGDIISYINCDDFYFPWTLELIVSVFEKGADIVYGNMISWNIEKDVVRFFIPPSPDKIRKILEKVSLGQPAVFLHRSAIDKVGLFDESLKASGDYDYWLRAIKVCKFAKVNEFLAVERFHKSCLRVREKEKRKVVLKYKLSSKARPISISWRARVVPAILSKAIRSGYVKVSLKYLLIGLIPKFGAYLEKAFLPLAPREWAGY